MNFKTYSTELENHIIEQLQIQPSEERIQVLQPLVDYLQQKAVQNKTAKLNFICTHNSRRSQLSQVWAQTAADYFQVKALCYSGGVEVTAMNPRTAKTLSGTGFRICSEGEQNPVYFIEHSEGRPMVAFSKLYDHPLNPDSDFAAVMTCSHADENCPFIPGAEARIPVRYEDPKLFDDTLREEAMYTERSLEIAREMFFVFKKLASHFRIDNQANKCSESHN